MSDVVTIGGKTQFCACAVPFVSRDALRASGAGDVEYNGDYYPNVDATTYYKVGGGPFDSVYRDGIDPNWMWTFHNTSAPVDFAYRSAPGTGGQDPWELVFTVTGGTSPAPTVELIQVIAEATAPFA